MMMQIMQLRRMQQLHLYWRVSHVPPHDDLEMRRRVQSLLMMRIQMTMGSDLMRNRVLMMIPQDSLRHYYDNDRVSGCCSERVVSLTLFINT